MPQAASSMCISVVHQYNTMQEPAGQLLHIYMGPNACSTFCTLPLATVRSCLYREKTIIHVVLSKMTKKEKKETDKK
jgi:hypothetical protein